MNFGENQFEDFMAYSEPNNYDEVVESPPAKERQIPSQKTTPVGKNRSTLEKTPSQKLTPKVYIHSIYDLININKRFYNIKNFNRISTT